MIYLNQKSMKNNIMAKNRTNLFLFLKALIIFGLILILLIPTLFISHLIDERETLRSEAVQEVSQKWASEQHLVGPQLAIPYYDENGKASENQYLAVMPENLKITGDVNTQILHRGIYDVVVYHTDMKISGNFSRSDFKDVPLEELCLERAMIAMEITDLRGVEDQLNIHLGEQDYRFETGQGYHGVGGLPYYVVHAFVNLGDTSSLDDTLLNNIPFTLSLSLKGSENLYISPIGGKTDVRLHSNWNNPSFVGDFLASEKKIDKNGFDAHWKMMHLNRDFPQSWNTHEKAYSPENSAFGVTFLLPVDGYQKATRCVKYSILFTTITFIVFFFVEIMRKKRVHPLQYLLVGVALIVFYTLLVSLSEYLAFNLAYILAALATIILITLYSKAVLKSWAQGGFVGGVLLVLYGYLFTIIQLQDYALLAGSIFIFIILGVVMFFSRKVDWYNLNGGGKDEGNTPPPPEIQ